MTEYRITLINRLFLYYSVFSSSSFNCVGHNVPNKDTSKYVQDGLTSANGNVLTAGEQEASETDPCRQGRMRESMVIWFSSKFIEKKKSYKIIKHFNEKFVFSKGAEAFNEERHCSPPETGGTLQWGCFNCWDYDR